MLKKYFIFNFFSKKLYLQALAIEYKNCFMKKSDTIKRIDLKKMLIVLLFIAISFSCRHDYALKLTWMELSPVKNTETKEHSIQDGWWKSEFQDNQLNFVLKFSYSGYTGDILARYYLSDYPVESTMKITCNKDVYHDSDTVRAGELLNESFLIQKYEPSKHVICFLISEKAFNDYFREEQYYTFKVAIETTENNILTDSCIVKRF